MSVAASTFDSKDLSGVTLKYVEFEELRDLFHDFPIEIAMYDPDGNYKFANKLYARNEELRKSLINQRDEFYFEKLGITPDSADKRKECFQRALEEKRTVGFTEKLFLPKENRTLDYKR